VNQAEDATPAPRPRLAPDVFLAEGAVVAGDVEIGPRSSLWFHAVVRGDAESVRIGAETNLQDGAILHADPGFPCEIGARVTIGHGAVVHGAIVEDDVLIGMRAVVLNGVRIGAGSLIGAGAIVPEGRVIPPRSLVLGVPARVRRELSEDESARHRLAASHYVENARRYALGQVCVVRGPTPRS
jgi:carbonic anhydrase/acetyltransferase-like protein (isoleucine patch superfamily)